MDFKLQDKLNAEIEKLKYFHEIAIKIALISTGNDNHGYTM
jgi:hypothetical protein